MLKKVLIVDDEEPFLLSLTDGLRAYEEDFNVLTASDGKEAIEALNTAKIDLVITDLRMPRMDGFELLAYLSRSYPDIPVIVMTAYGTSEVEDQLQSMGTFQYLEKPLEFNTLRDRIFEGLAASSTGFIQGISLAAILQLLEMERKTCTLKITSHEKVGYLYMVKGELMNAETKGIQGQEAALDIVTWDNAAIEITYKCKVRKKIVESPLTELLLESCRIKDERAAEEGSLDSGRSSAAEVSNDEVFTGAKKEVLKMNVQKLHQAIDIQKEHLGEGLLATDIYASSDGQSLVGWNSNPQACALFNRITQMLLKALDGSAFPKLTGYYIINLEGGYMVVVLPLGDYQWGMLINTQKMQLGLLLNVAIPKMIEVFEAAKKG